MKAIMKAMRFRNYPPPSGIRVPVEDMRKLVIELCEKGGTSRDHGEHMADLLVRNDLRCVFSHGTQKISQILGSQCLKFRELVLV